MLNVRVPETDAIELQRHRALSIVRTLGPLEGLLLADPTHAYNGQQLGSRHPDGPYPEAWTASRKIGTEFDRLGLIEVPAEAERGDEAFSLEHFPNPGAIHVSAYIARGEMLMAATKGLSLVSCQDRIGGGSRRDRHSDRRTECASGRC
jgi:hypothetical protein